MDCKNCCESVDGKPGNGACIQCQHDEEAMRVGYAKSLGTVLESMLGVIKERTHK